MDEEYLMYLEKTYIYNFRGIRHLCIDFTSQSTIIIGENSWGKSSLLRALSMMLGEGNKLCSFSASDLYVPISLDEQFNFQDPNDKNTNASNVQNLEGLSTEQKLNIFLQKLHEDQHEMLEENIDNEFLEQNIDNDFLDFDKQDNLFASEDIYKDDLDTIQIDLIFSEHISYQHNSCDLEQLKDVMYFDDTQGAYKIHWRAVGFFTDEENFITEHYLLDKNENPIVPEPKEHILKLISLHPILRLRDSRMVSNNDINIDSQLEPQDSMMMLNLIQDRDFSSDDFSKALSILKSLTSKYLSDYSQRFLVKKDQKKVRTIKDIVNRPVSIESLETLHDTLVRPQFSATKFILAFLASSIVASKNKKALDPNCHPLLIIEDIESRFHPSLLMALWSVIEALPIQRIVTTYSGDLLSAINISNLRRVAKHNYDTRTYSINEKSFSSDELRKIAFHIRINRPMSFFARCWILVEGETEVWLLTEIAAMLGISLQAKGIRIIEYAQCGLSPIMKLARHLGIGFYVLTDGDDAGERYAQSVYSFLGPVHSKNHLTILPSLDIEHYFYNNGFSQVFIDAAGMAPSVQRSISIDKVIEQAVRKKSKPALALSILEKMGKNPKEKIPHLFVHLFNVVLCMSKASY